MKIANHVRSSAAVDRHDPLVETAVAARLNGQGHDCDSKNENDND